MRVRLGSVGDLGESMVRPESEVRVDSIESNGVVLEELREQNAAEFRENVDVEKTRTPVDAGSSGTQNPHPLRNPSYPHGSPTAGTPGGE